MTLFPSMVMPKGQSVIDADLKGLIKRWKKEAKLHRNRTYEDVAKCRCLDLTLEICAESIEALLRVRAP